MLLVIFQSWWRCPFSSLIVKSENSVNNELPNLTQNFSIYTYKWRRTGYVVHITRPKELSLVIVS